MWQSWVLAIIGIWVIIMSYLGLSESAMTSWHWITGIVIIILGVWGAVDRGTAR